MSKVTSIRLQEIPKKPGVYLMRDQAGKVLYIGKAKNLFHRVRSYFASKDGVHGDGRYNIQFLMGLVDSLETIVTHDERQALVLEADLVRTYQPRYNIRLKDDKAHLLVRIDHSQEWPRLELVRKVERDGAEYLGPFPFAREVRTLLELIKRVVPLRTCSDKVMKNRVRPCLEYQIKRCAGPCCIAVAKADYAEWLAEAKAILQGQTREIQQRLELQMEFLSEELRYEEAAALRDRIELLKVYQKERPLDRFLAGEIDAWGIYREGDQAEIVNLRTRANRIQDVKSFELFNMQVPDDEILSTALTEFYLQADSYPEEILLPFKIELVGALREIISERKGGAVKISYPQRGKKHDFLLLADENARENFNARAYRASAIDQSLNLIREALGLEGMPRVIECIDIAHFQGESTVGAVVAFKDGIPEKSRYRLFKLAQEGKPNDFDSIYEVVRRHLSRLVAENALPDLLVIDGGREQLAKALEARDQVCTKTFPIIALAKERALKSHYESSQSGYRVRDRVFVPGVKVELNLAVNDPGLLMLGRIRDEAHRFVNASHRKSLRKKRVAT
ncbi:excinuclease ABC subunit UvrC [bacterium]|nr:excinuclease ABC subunit UvrC [bacterium]